MSETAAITSVPPASMTPKQADNASSGSDGSFKQVMDQVSADRRPAPAQDSDGRSDEARTDSGDAGAAKETKDGKEHPAAADAAANPAAALPLTAQLLPVQTTAQAATGAAANEAGTKAAGVDAALAVTDAGATLKQTLAKLKDSAVPVAGGRAEAAKGPSVEKAQTGASDATAAKSIPAGAQADSGKASTKSAGSGDFPLDKAGEAQGPTAERPLADAAQTQTAIAGATGQPAAPRADRADAAALVQSTPVTHPRFGDAISHQITVLAQDGVQHAKISLNPPELGPVEVRISLRQDEATVQLAAASGVTRHAIEDALPKLRDMLDQVGVRLGDTGVFAQLPQKGGAENFGAWRSEHAPVFGTAAELAGEDVLPGAGALGRVASGLVDAYV